MYNGMSDEFVAAFQEQYRGRVKIKALIGDTEYTSESGVITDMEITESIGDADTLPVGTSGSAECRITINQYMKTLAQGTVIKPYVGIGDLDEWCPLGVFYLDSIDSDDNFATETIIAYDALSAKADVEYVSKLIYPQTAEAVLAECMEQCGISTDMSASEYASGWEIEEEPVGMTCREVIEGIAGFNGSNAAMGRTGKLEFRVYGTSDDRFYVCDTQVFDGTKVTSQNDMRIYGFDVNDTWTFGQFNATPVQSWEIGEDIASAVKAYLYQREDGNYSLEIVGTGGRSMPNYTQTSRPPWESVKGQIVEVHIDGVINVGTWAFFGYDALKTVTLSDEVNIVGNYAFWACKNLETVELPSETEGGFTFGEASFSATGITNITIPSVDVSSGSVNIIRQNAFDQCDQLCKRETLVIPRNTEMEANCFAYCTGMLEVKIERTGTIPETAFDGSGVKRITCVGTKTSYNYAKAPWGATGATVIYEGRVYG